MSRGVLEVFDHPGQRAADREVLDRPVPTQEHGWRMSGRGQLEVEHPVASSRDGEDGGEEPVRGLRALT
jgi:hypothetical protein